MNHSSATRLTCGILAAALLVPSLALAQVAPPLQPTTPPAAPAQTTPSNTTPPVKPNLPARPANPNIQREAPRTAPPGVATPTTPVSTAQAISFDPKVLDLGDLIPDVAKTSTITVTNISDHPVKIIKIQPSCGCTTTSAPPAPLAPGESAKVDITLKAPAKGGAKVQKSVSFQIEGHMPQVLAVEGFVREYVSLTPEVLDAPPSENPAPVTVRVTSKDKNPVKVTGSQPDVFVSIPTEAAETHDLQLDWAKWRAAGTPAKIAVLTDHPKAAQVVLLVKKSIKDNPLAPNPTATNNPVNTATPAIIVSTREGNIDKVKEALKSGADIEAIEPSSRRTALHFAAESGKADMVKALLDAKANPNAPDRTGRTPLAVAAEKRHPEALKLLIASGGDVEIRDQMGGTPVIWASALGNTATVRILLDAGANVNVTDKQGLTPLSWAANIGSPETVGLLIERGANVKSVDTLARETALIRAVRTGNTESVKILLSKGSDLNVRNNQGMTPFLVACASGDLDKIKLLLDAGADKTVVDSKGWGAIDHARNRLDSKKSDVIKFLEPIVPASAAVAPPQTKDAEKAEAPKEPTKTTQSNP